jgi:hypothetical protein
MNNVVPLNTVSNGSLLIAHGWQTLLPIHFAKLRWRRIQPQTDCYGP